MPTYEQQQRRWRNEARCRQAQRVLVALGEGAGADHDRRERCVAALACSAGRMMLLCPIRTLPVLESDTNNYHSYLIRCFYPPYPDGPE